MARPGKYYYHIKIFMAQHQFRTFKNGISNVCRHVVGEEF